MTNTVHSLDNLEAFADFTSVSSRPQETDNVNHPAHYTQGGIECIEAIKASMTPAEFQGYCKGNTLKYIWRWREKGGVEDLEKAMVYLKWMIESAKEEASNQMP